MVNSIKAFWTWFYLITFTGFGIRAVALLSLFFSIYFLLFTRKTSLALVLFSLSFAVTYLFWIPAFLLTLGKTILQRLWL